MFRHWAFSLTSSNNFQLVMVVKHRINGVIKKKRAAGAIDWVIKRRKIPKEILIAKFKKTGITTAHIHDLTDIPTNFLQKKPPPDTFTILYPE